MNMTEFMIEVAGCRVAVSALYENTRNFCSDYLCDGTPDFSVELTEEDLAEERKRSEEVHTDLYLETIALQRKLTEVLFSRNILLFHGSAVAVDGACYIFTAKSGTGKSTHTRFWREVFGERAVMVNDDKPFLSISKEGITVCGTPWNGKHHLGTNIQVPLKAICILERGEKNRIEAITAKEALPILLQQSHRPGNPRWMGKYLDLLDGLANGTAFYWLQCNMSPEAALVAYRTMSGKTE